MDYAELQEKFPFLSCIKYANNEYVGILQNQDTHVTSIYVYDLIKSEKLKEEFLDLGEIWWWESNRQIPINLFLRNDWSAFQNTMVSLNIKDCEIKFGPSVSIHNLAKKRGKRRNIQLVKRVK